jgi:hypothetical protein
MGANRLRLTVLVGSWFWHSQISFSSKAAKPR